MLGQLDIAGVYIHSLLIYGAIAFLFNLVLRRILLTTGFYRLVWHRALFDLALFTILLASIVGTTSSLLEP
jgi:protein AaeX